MQEPQDSLHQRVIAVLDEVRIAIAQDGGDIQLIKIEDAIVYLQFMGACVGCPFSFYTLTFGVEKQLKERIPEIQKVIAV